MGNPKQKWTSEEEEALRAGVAKHGAGKWKLIQKDVEFNKYLHSRSNIDLKDKWRNMSAAVQGSRDKMRPAKPKAVQDAPATPSVHILAPATPSVPKQTPAALPMPVIHESPADHVKDDSGKDIPDSKNGPRYNEMIFEVLEEQSGMDIGSILAHIEKKSDVQVPQNFRKQLGARLRRLVAQDKLEKVDNHYRLKNNTLETNGSGQKGIWARQHPSTVYSKVSESVEEAAKTAAYKVAEAEYTTSLAAESVKDFEKLLKKAEETDTILQLAKEIFERCTHGEVLVVA